MSTKHMSFSRITEVVLNVAFFSGMALLIKWSLPSFDWTTWLPNSGVTVGGSPIDVFAGVLASGVAGWFPAPSVVQKPVACSGIDGRRVARVWHENGCLSTSTVSATPATKPLAPSATHRFSGAAGSSSAISPPTSPLDWKAPAGGTSAAPPTPATDPVRRWKPPS